jgi:predicted nucleic acid-binding protein
MADLELGFAARNAGEWDRIRHAAAGFAAEEVAAEGFRRAGQVQRMLATAGLKGRKVPDLLIAAVAERAQRAVLHYDHDFELIAQQTVQPHQWLVPAGSVD